jgi:predicted anti-sigma-YlaC factor YlaD
MIKCPEIINELEAYRKGEAASELKALIAAHLDACPDCRSELKALEQLDVMLDTYQVAPPAVALGAELRRKTAAWENARPAYGFNPGWRRLGWLASAAAVMLAALIWLNQPFNNSNAEPEMIADIELLEDMEIAQLIEIDQDYDLLVSMPEIIDTYLNGE